MEGLIFGILRYFVSIQNSYLLKTNKKDSYKANFQYTVPPLSSFYGMKKKTFTIIRNSWVSVKTNCKEFISLARERIKRWFSNAHDFKLIVMDMLLKRVRLHKREVLFSLTMSICCYLDLLLPKKFSPCWFLRCLTHSFSFMPTSSFQQKRRRKRNWNFKLRLAFSLTNQLTEGSSTSPCDVMV